MKRHGLLMTRHELVIGPVCARFKGGLADPVTPGVPKLIETNPTIASQLLFALYLPAGFYERKNDMCYFNTIAVLRLGKVTRVEVDPDDPALDSTIHVNIWGRPSGSSQYSGEYLLAWLRGDEEKQTMRDPSTEAGEYELWEKLVLARNIISLDISMKPSGQGDASPLLVEESDRKQVKPDLLTYNKT
eukprot:g28073.t1